MASRKRRLLLWLATVVGLVLLLAGLGAWWLLGSEGGTRWAFSSLADRLFQGSFEVGRSSGPLGGPLELEDVVYETDTLRLEIERLRIEWTLSGLLRERLVVHELVADGVTVIRKGAAERKDDPLPDITLPIDIVVEDALVRRIRILRGEEEPVVIDSIALASSLRGERVEIERLAVRSPLFDVDLVGEIRPQGAYPVDFEVDWSTTIGEVRWAGSGAVRGTLERVAIDQRLHAPAAAHVVATLDEPLLDLAFDGIVDAAPFDPAVLGFELPIAIDSVGGRLALEGELEVFRATGDLRLATPEYGPLLADVTLVRDHDRLRIERLVATRPSGGDLRVTASGDVRFAEGPARFDLELAWRGLPYPLVGEPWIESASGSGRIAGTAADYSLEADARLAAARLPEGRWTLLARGGGESFVIRRLRGSLGGGEVAAAGTVVPGENPRFDLDVSWSDLAYPFRGEPTIESSAGSAEITGTLADYDVEIDALVRGPRLGEGRLVLAGSGDREHLDVAAARTQLFGGEIAAAGRVAWSPQVTWDLELEASGLDPAVWRADYPGDLDLVASSSGRLADDGPVGTLAPFRLDGTLRGAPISASGGLRLDGGITRVSDLDVAWGGARLAAAGTIGPPWDLAFELAVPDLSLVASDAAGELRAAGRLAGSDRLPAVTAELAATELVWGELALAAVGGEVAVDLRPGGALAVDLEGRDLVYGERRVERVGIETAGTVDGHVIHLVAALPDELGERGGTHRVELAGALDLDALRWRGELRDVATEVPGFGRWRLEEPAALVASRDAVAVERFCLARDAAALCLGGRWRDAAGWRVLGGLVEVPLELAEPFLPPDLDVDGTVDGIVRLRGDAAGLTAADIDLRPGPGAIVVEVGGEPTRFAFDRGVARVFTTDEGLAGHVRLLFPELGEARADLLLPGFSSLSLPAEDQPLRGEVVADVDDLSFVAALSSRFTNVSGRLDARFTLGGTLGAPRPEGSIALAGGALDVPDYGIELRDLEIQATSDGSQAFDLAGSVTSGEGTLAIGGRLSLVPSPETPVRLELRGERFVAVDRSDLRVVASPDVVATYDGSILEIGGEILVPEATVEYTRREGVLQPSRDVVVVRGGEEERSAFRDLDLVARLRLTLGEDVHIEALGLEGDLEGSILVTDQPSKPVQATGELRIVEGTYTAYGQDLEIERGRLYFAGGTLDDPGIDLRASRRADDGVVAGIEVDGRLQAPVVEVWSEPEMSETDSLAYLLLGRPLATAGENDTSLLARAAEGLGVGGGNLLFGRLAESAGLEEARIESEGGLEEAAFVVGKYLSPGLYVAYGIGLFEPVSTFRIRYTLSSKWSLEAEVGEETTADVFYSIESGD